MQSDRQSRTDAGLEPDRGGSVEAAIFAAVAAREPGAGRSSAGATPFTNGLQVPV